MKHQLRFLRQLAATCLGLAFSLLVLIATPALSSPAQASGAFTLSAPHLPLAATAGRVKADAKEFEGKTQESIGNVTGNQGDRLAGMAKQTEAKVRNAVEDVKDKTGMS
ncbi:MAG: CsbD family protein [Cyanobium sp.]|uniref:CsbD family protein n=1 Tax=Synechococcus sp. CS-1333 TaxID=2848638 RepID=UPI000DBBD89E|nr:CsbD family protein [Synechococcus sp. CS-1333]MCT0211891.1 CsbD family protein [Synechococcus sp. CS-1333]PZV22668.1 MAG: CsbD family protein [Cyanobium sp.]